MMTLPEVLVDSRGYPSVAEPSPSLLEHLLDEYEREVASRGIDTADALLPGIPEQRSHALLAEHGLVLTDEVAVWFAWHNGVRLGPNGESLGDVTPGVQLASLEILLERYDSRRLDPEEVSGDPEWNSWGLPSGWLQLEPKNLSIGVDCTTAGAGAPLVRMSSAEFDIDARPPVQQARSLCTVVTWWIEALRNGVYTRRDDGSWQIDSFARPRLQRLYFFA